MENLDFVGFLLPCLMRTLSKARKSKHSFWENRPALVTGGTGFIGSWLTEELVKRGARVVVLDIIPFSPVLNSLSRKPLIIQADVRDFSVAAGVIRKYKIETIFHLASQALVEIASKEPFLTLETNISGTYTILEAARNFGTVKRIVIASSDKAYGEHNKLPYREDAALQGTYPYDVSKSCADLISRMYFKSYNLPVCVTRCGNVFGGGDRHFSRLIPHIIHSALYNKRPVIRSDGAYIRDYIYVKDIVDGYIGLAEAMEGKEILGESFNFGNNRPLSVLRVVRVILSAMKKNELKPRILNRASREIRRQYLLSEKAGRLLGWKPKYDFEEAVKETIDWYKAYFKK